MLTLTNITKTFNAGTVNEKTALDNLSLHLDAGEFATIVGSNGAGKSTMFGAIVGNFYVDQGTIELDWEDITFLREYRNWGVFSTIFRGFGRLYGWKRLFLSKLRQKIIVADEKS